MLITSLGYPLYAEVMVERKVESFIIIKEFLYNVNAFIFSVLLILFLLDFFI